MDESHYKAGFEACETYYKSSGFAGLSRGIKAEDAMKLFLPSIPEFMTMVETPYPKDRTKWLAGWKGRMKEIIAGLDNASN